MSYVFCFFIIKNQSVKKKIQFSESFFFLQKVKIFLAMSVECDNFLT